MLFEVDTAYLTDNIRFRRVFDYLPILHRHYTLQYHSIAGKGYSFVAQTVNTSKEHSCVTKVTKFKRAVLYNRSHVPKVVELFWVMQCI